MIEKMRWRYDELLQQQQQQQQLNRTCELYAHARSLFIHYAAVLIGRVTVVVRPCVHL